MDTVYHVTAKQLDKSFAIKDTFILKQLIDEVEKYREKLNSFGLKYDHLTVFELAEKLNEVEKPKVEEIKPDDINVISYGRSRIDELRELNRTSSAGNMTTVVNGLVDYFKSDFVPITAITAKMLLKYEAYLKRPRILERPNQFQKQVTTHEPGLTDNGLHCHFKRLENSFQ